MSIRPRICVFKPAGVPRRDLPSVTLSVDELEALRLMDLDGLYQEQAGERMRVSRSTLARLVESARRKTADALVNGKALLIDGGPVHFPGERCRCRGQRWQSSEVVIGGASARRGESEEER